MGNTQSRPGFYNPYASTMGLRPVPIPRTRRPGGPPRRTPVPVLVRETLKRLPANAVRSSTQTVTKRKVKKRGRIRAGGRGQSTYFVDKMKTNFLAKNVYKSLIGHQGIANSVANFAISGIGQQEAILFPIMKKDDLAAIKTICTGATAKTAKIFMKSYTASLNMRNQTNQPLRMKIYDLVCRNDTISPGYDDPIECWNKGLQDNTGVGTDNYKIPFQSPNRSDEFKYYWKVLNCQTVELAGGDPHVHHVTIKMNRMLDTTPIDNGTQQAIAGWTHYVMVVFIGSLSNSTQVNTEVTFCPVKLDYLYTNTIKFAYLEKNLPTYTIATRPITTVTGALEAMADNGISNLTPATN